MTPVKVLDAWAVVAWLQNEKPASDLVQSLLGQSDSGALTLFISWINVGEVYYTLLRRLGAAPAEEFVAGVPSLPVTTVVPDRNMILAAARWKGLHKLSYADAFAVEMAVRLKATLVSGDPELQRLERVGVLELEWLGA